MRLLHTSDWHIGKRFEETDLLPLQAGFCDWIVDLATREKVDGVLIAGDLFDRSNPKPDSVDLVDDVLNRLHATGASLVVISGNHDSAERLNFGARFMTGAGLHIRAERPNLDEVGAPVIITDASGNSVEILPLPYIDPQRVRVPEGSRRTHDSVLETVINQHRLSLKDPARTVVMSHAFITNGLASDSERPLSVGGTGMIPASLFEGFGYVALGHLHRPQVVGNGNIVYSGSPMSYSFSEEHTKSVRIIDIGDSIDSTEIKVDIGRPVVTLSDTLENLIKSPKYDVHKQSFVRARLTDKNLQLGVMEKLRARFPHVLLTEQTSLTEQGALSRDQADRAHQSPIDIVDSYVDESFEDIDEFQREFVAKAVAGAVNGDTK